jgi:RimJ/RimL family protein N-acetyltransferase
MGRTRWGPPRSNGASISTLLRTLHEGIASRVVGGFDYQPVLKGELLTLRPLAAADHDDLYAVASDPLIWAQHPDQTRFKPDGFRAFFDQSLASGGALVAIDTKTQRIIGSSRYHAFNRETREVEVGWTFLARAYWGGRYNGEMKRLMLEHAFQFVDSVVLLIGPENWRSQRAAEKIGAVRDGLRRDAHGRESFVYRVTASAFR